MTHRRARRFPVLVTALVAGLVLAGCGGPAPAPDAAAPAAEDGTFPVTVAHAFGETTIPARPARVVALGAGDLAVAQAVGAPVVGAVRNPAGSTPQLPYLAPLPAEVLSIPAEATTVDPEQIAAFRPDLVLATGAYQIADRATFDRLSRIAPTVVFPRSLYGSPMQDDARLIGRALGTQAEVEQLIADAERRTAEVRAQLPGLVGRTYLYGQARGEVLPMVVGEQNLSTVFMRSLGLQVPESFRNAPASDALAPGTVGISYEESSRLSDADLLLMTFATDGDRSTFEGNELIRRVRAVQRGTYTALTLDQAVALQAPNVVSTAWLIDQLRPSLEKVAAAG